MRKTNDKSLKEAIEQMLQVYKIKRKFNETGVIASWPEIVGKPMANRTKELFIHDKKLFLKVESSVIRNEMSLMKIQIIEKINENSQEKLIEDIIFL